MKYDEALDAYYRDAKCLYNDPNGLFKKGQIIMQYSKSGHLYDFNGIKTQEHYYIYTKKDAENGFKYCSFIATANPFVKNKTLKKINLSNYEIL